FAWEAERDPTTLLSRNANRISDVVTPDEQTAILHWTHASSEAGEFSFLQLDILPRWILGETLIAEKTALATHPYFNEAGAFVGLGPFRTIEWNHGVSLSLDAFDRYFLGRPKIDTIILQTIPEPSTATANVLAGSVDVAYLVVPLAQALEIQQ